MENSFSRHLSEIIYRLNGTKGMNINTLSLVSEIPEDIVREILLELNSNPFGFISFKVEDLKEDELLEELPYEVLDERIRWSVKLSSKDKIPVENLDREEQLIVQKLIEGIIEEDYLDIFLSKNTSDSAMMIKGTSSETNEIFESLHYLKIRGAFIRNEMLLLKVNGQNHEITPAGMVFHSEREQWYLVGMLCDEEVRSFCIGDIEAVTSLYKPGKPRMFDMKEYLRHCFDLELAERHDVEVVFENYGNVKRKARRKLSGRGEFTETDNGSVIFTGSLSGIDEFKKWIYSFGQAARITKPEWLAEEQINEWKKLLESYAGLEELIRGMKV